MSREASASSSGGDDGPRRLTWSWVAKCRVLGGTATRELHEEAVGAGEGAVPLLVDVLSRRDFREGMPADCALIPVHAMRVLGALRAASAIPALVAVLNDPVDPGLYGDEASTALARIGEPALAPLEGLLFDRQREHWVRVGAARGLLLAALADRRRRRRVRDAWERLLRDPGEHDRTLLAHVVASACQLAAEALLPAIDAAFAAGRIDEDVIDSESARLDLMTRRHRPDPETKALARADPAEDYVRWSELAAGMDASERERLEAELARWDTEEAAPPSSDDDLLAESGEDAEAMDD